MTFSTRNNPRLAQTPIALTSLGAVGGKRGTAAGALRILVEFATTYNKGAVDELENDLRQIEARQATSSRAELARNARAAKAQTQLAQIAAISRGKLDTAQRGELKRVEALEALRGAGAKANAAAARVQLNAVLKSAGLSQKEIDLLGNKTKLQKQLVNISNQQARAEEGQRNRLKDQISAEEHLQKVQTGRAQLGAKLSGLAIGAIGGLVGGALLGVGFQLAQDAMTAIGEKIKDLFDPARHSRDALNELGDAINKLAASKQVTLLDAARETLKNLGIEADNETAKLLVEAAALKTTADRLDELNKLREAQAHPTAVKDQLVQQEASRLAGLAIQKQKDLGLDVGKINSQMFLVQALKNVMGIEDQAIQHDKDLAAARAALAFATANAAISQENLVNALNHSVTIRVGLIEEQASRLVEVSAKTKSIQAALTRAQSAGSSNAATLRSLAEERQLILLRQRLRLMGTAIDLERYSGKFLLEAINAKIEALNKQGQAQSRLNALLDLQFRMSKTITRQQGETISDFLERRAQENRGFLSEQADLERQKIIDDLEVRKTALEDELALRANAEARKNALTSSGVSARIKQLEKELAASQAADKAALASKQKQLDDKKKAIEEAAQEAEKILTDSVLTETRIALEGVDSIEALEKIKGRIAGYVRAKATLEALVDGFGIPAGIAKPFLDKINNLLGLYRSKQFTVFPDLLRSMDTRAEGHYAKGGVFPLRNSMSPFGQNVRAGEHGTEIGIILSNKVAAMLQKQTGPQQVGPFNLYGSVDPLRDIYRFKRLVSEAVSEAMN